MIQTSGTFSVFVMDAAARLMILVLSVYMFQQMSKNNTQNEQPLIAIKQVS